MIAPAVIFFFSSIIWIMNVYRVHSAVGNIVTNAGNEVVNYSYLIKDNSEEPTEYTYLLASLGWSEIYLRNKIEELENPLINELSCALSEINGNGFIDILVTYRVEPYFKIPGYKGIRLSNRYYSKMYTNKETRKTTEYVYIAKESEVYHSSMDCLAIKKTVSSILSSELEKARNRSGKKYYPCGRCAKEAESIVAYITPHGVKYHFDPNCKELNVQLFRISIEEIGTRRRCHYCQ